MVKTSSARSRRRPAAAARPGAWQWRPTPKVQITLRVDPDILAAFRKTGRGWQSRMNTALRQALPAERR